MPPAAVALAAAATLLALGSALHLGRSLWRGLDRQRAAYAPLTSTERAAMPLAEVGVPGAVFDFYASFLAPGDRAYFQVPQGAPGRRRALLRSLEAAGRFALLPAVVTPTLADATVVLSYDADPSLLHVSFVTQRRDGRERVYVSRIGSP